MRPLPLAIPALLLSLAAPLAQAESRPVTETRPLNADAKLTVRNTAGLIEVGVWDKNQIALDGVLGEGVERLLITGDASELNIEVKNRTRGSYHNSDSQLHLKVPASVALTLEGTSADLVVQGLRGALTARTVSGDVNLEIGSRRVEARSVSGDVNVAAAAAEHVSATTVSGDLAVTGGSGTLLGESVSGDVTVHGGRYSRLELKSVSGDVEIHADTTADAQIKAESLSGDVRFDAPASLSAEVTLKTFSGDKNCAFDGAMQSEGMRTVVKKIGGGAGRVTLTSFSGDVNLDKR